MADLAGGVDPESKRRALRRLAEADQYDEGDAIEADLARQIEAAGYRWLLDLTTQRYRWVRVGESVEEGV